MIESDGESEESEVVHIEWDTSRKCYVSSSGRRLHIFPECLGRHARISHYKMCVHCTNRLTDEYTGDYASLEEIKLQEGVKDF